MNRVKLCLILALVAGLLGCSKRLSPRHIVILIDVSGSIEQSAERAAFKATSDLADSLHRGDRITIIPITRDAQSETSGRILRFVLPDSRQAYDNDLQSFKVNLKKSLEEMESEAIAYPGKRTDILGSIALAGQEFEGDPHDSKKVLVVLSDFIQESPGVDFKTDSRLSDLAMAKRFATRVVNPGVTVLSGVPTYLGLLRSPDYLRMLPLRREGIREFWITCFAENGAQPRFVTDGVGLLRKFLRMLLNQSENRQIPPVIKTERFSCK